MGVVSDIKKSKNHIEELLKAKNEYEQLVETINRKYNKNKDGLCKHEIIVKFYGTMQSYNNDKPLYICLGCCKNLSDEKEEVENYSTRHIIDFSGEYWYDVSKMTNDLKHYALVEYLRDLALKDALESRCFIEEEFVEKINNNVSYIMKNNSFSYHD